MNGKLWIIISDALFSIIALVVTVLLTPDNTIRPAGAGHCGGYTTGCGAIIKLLYDIQEKMVIFTQILKAIQSKK